MCPILNMMKMFLKKKNQKLGVFVTIDSCCLIDDCWDGMPYYGNVFHW